MDKKEALIILIKHSYILTDDDKIKILGNLDTLSSEEIDKFGEFLAEEKKFSIEHSGENIKKLEEAIDKLNALQVTAK